MLNLLFGTYAFLHEIYTRNKYVDFYVNSGNKYSNIGKH